MPSFTFAQACSEELWNEASSASCHPPSRAQEWFSQRSSASASASAGCNTSSRLRAERPQKRCTVTRLWSNAMYGIVSMICVHHNVTSHVFQQSSLLPLRRLHRLLSLPLPGGGQPSTHTVSSTKSSIDLFSSTHSILWSSETVHQTKTASCHCSGHWFKHIQVRPASTSRNKWSSSGRSEQAV